jgi:hypothetical protein
MNGLYDAITVTPTAQDKALDTLEIRRCFAQPLQTNSDGSKGCYFIFHLWKNNLSHRLFLASWTLKILSFSWIRVSCFSWPIIDCVLCLIFPRIMPCERGKVLKGSGTFRNYSSRRRSRPPSPSIPGSSHQQMDQNDEERDLSSI